MIIQYLTDKARESLIPLPDLATLRKLYPQLVSDDVLQAAGVVKKNRRLYAPLSSLRFTGGSAAEIEASARRFAKEAGVKEAAVPSFFRFNTAALRKRTIPFGEAALAYFKAAHESDAVYSAERGGIVRKRKAAAAAPRKRGAAKKAAAAPRKRGAAKRGGAKKAAASRRRAK